MYFYKQTHSKGDSMFCVHAGSYFSKTIPQGFSEMPTSSP